MAQAIKNATAGTPAADPKAAQAGQYLTFVLGTETFAIGIMAIKEIIEYASLTEVPMMPAYVRGVINLRGAVVPVLDLPVRFGKASSEVTKRTCIVIIDVMLGTERHVLGLVVDAVNAVLDIPLNDIEPPPAFGASIRTEFIRGMVKINSKFVIVIDVDHVLAADEVLALTDIQQDQVTNGQAA
jgi:purine-binding chemotaxis protein CheW